MPNAADCLCLCLATLATAGMGAAKRRRPDIMPTPPIVGRWDITVQAPPGPYPSWFEVQQSGYSTLVGYFVGRFGSMRPISRVHFARGRLRIAVPVQWEHRHGDLVFEGRLTADRLKGTTTTDDGRRATWTAVRAPGLARPREPRWAEPVELFNGKDLTGWTPHDVKAPNGWRVRNGLMVNARPGNDLVTAARFSDFKLHTEFRYPKSSNSGIYLRGRYEVQIEDNYGQAPDSHRIGGIYGFIKPRLNAARKAGEWQTFDITLIGRSVTVALNGETIIDRQEIPGPTGGALDSNEGLPGPIYIQGDHGPIEFKRITITQAK